MTPEAANADERAAQEPLRSRRREEADPVMWNAECGMRNEAAADACHSFGALFPLTLALSLGEREKRASAWRIHSPA